MLQNGERKAFASVAHELPQFPQPVFAYPDFQQPFLPFPPFPPSVQLAPVKRGHETEQRSEQSGGRDRDSARERQKTRKNANGKHARATVRARSLSPPPSSVISDEIWHPAHCTAASLPPSPILNPFCHRDRGVAHALPLPPTPPPPFWSGVVQSLKPRKSSRNPLQQAVRSCPHVDFFRAGVVPCSRGRQSCL